MKQYRVFYNKDCLMYGVQVFVPEYCGRRNYWTQVLPPANKGGRKGQSAYTYYKGVAERWLKELQQEQIKQDWLNQ